MRPEDIRQYLRQRPFRPFRITLTDGRTYDIGHHELAMVGRSTVIVGIASAEDPEPIFDRIVTVSLLHVMQTELIDGEGRTV